MQIGRAAELPGSEILVTGDTGFIPACLLCFLELTAFWWTLFDSEGLHRKLISALHSLARLGYHSVHSAVPSTLLCSSQSEHHGDKCTEAVT